MSLQKDLAELIKGDVEDSAETIEKYSHDASMYEVKPQVVVFPRDSEDVKAVVKYAADKPEVFITPRGAGTDMSGGAIGESIVMDFTRYFTATDKVSPTSVETQPGVFYRDFEEATLEHGAIMPSYPASRELCSVGGIVANNSGGEKSLSHGKTIDYVKRLQVVLADGNEYTLEPLKGKALESKLAQQDFEGEVYRGIHKLIDKNYDTIKQAEPNVSKNSTGYNLWDVWDRESGVFDLTKLIVGSQGTLGIVTEIEFKLVKKATHSGVLVCFLKQTDNLGEVVNKILGHKPESLESFDDHTLMLSIKFFFSFIKTLGLWGLIKLGISLIPDALLMLRGIPKLVVLAEFTGESTEEVTRKIRALRADLKPFGFAMESNETEAKSRKFWIMRRESFNLLRQKVKDKHTVPFIDDFVVPPEHLPEFLPQIRKIIRKYKLLATVAGHVGDGNFHIIPLMEIEKQSERAKLEPAMREVNELVLKYKGSLSGEHNDGLVRGPWLEEMYGEEVLGLFKQAKAILDPDNIFNPRIKTNADWDYSMSHIRKKF